RTSALLALFFFSSRRRHTRCYRDWSSDVCSSDLLIDQLPSFKRRMEWFINNWEDINNHVEQLTGEGHNEHMLLAIVNREKLPRILKMMLDESEFLSEYGLRSVSRYHKDHPFMLAL